MNILLITNMYPSKELPYSGIFVKAQYECLQEINEDNESVDIYCMRQVVSSKLGSYLKYLLAYVRFIPRLFKSYDIIHVHFYGILAPTAILYKMFHPRTKLLVTMHGGDINDDLPASGTKNKLFRKWIKSFDKVMPVGQALHKPVMDKLGVKPDHTLCAGVDKRKFYPPTKDVEKDIDFLVVGSFLPVKGLDVLLDAIPQLDNSKAKFCFVGNGPLEESIKSMQGEYNLEIAGNKTHDELREMYWRSKYLLFTSRGDAFGLVVTEAIYSGTPAIVCANGGAQHQISEGNNGFIYEANEADILTQKLNQCLALVAADYKKLAERTPQTNSEFSLQNVCSTFLSFYRKLHYGTSTIKTKSIEYGSLNS
ncbi:MAG: glycosyltransferase involved in cell wall biosynthesis [Litorivivens sp.]|jgi:glycosyltransferase involved in cell wall biosynthesis